jgi:hypothetical protein
MRPTQVELLAATVAIAIILTTLLILFWWIQP